eukprot:g11503.t1
MVQGEKEGELIPKTALIYDGSEHQPGSYHRRGLTSCYRYWPDPNTEKAMRLLVSITQTKNLTLGALVSDLKASKSFIPGHGLVQDKVALDVSGGNDTLMAGTLRRRLTSASGRSLCLCSPPGYLGHRGWSCCRLEMLVPPSIRCSQVLTSLRCLEDLVL